MRRIVPALCAVAMLAAFTGPARAICIESYYTDDGRYVTRDCPAKEGRLWGLLAGVAGLAVIAYAINNPGQDYEAASLTVNPIAYDRTLGFGLVYRPDVIPGEIGFRMIRPAGGETHMSLRYAIGY